MLLPPPSASAAEKSAAPDAADRCTVTGPRRRGAARAPLVLLASLLLPGCANSEPDTGAGGASSNPDACATEGESRACYPGEPATLGIGQCTAGASRCTAGLWGDCEGAVLPTTEGCNAVDDDCNGMTDEGCACASGAEQPCYGGPPATRGVGRCHDGVQRCLDEQWSASCDGEAQPAAEQCNAVDDDCNGLTDELDCSCVPDAVEYCYTGPVGTEDHGVCQAGSRTCLGGTWGGCTGEILPASGDLCGDELDNDCDDGVDEGCAIGRCADEFEDVPPTHWAYPEIMAVYYHEVTNGCSTEPLRYCPEASTSRAQLAAFIIRGMDEAESVAEMNAYFDDLSDPGSAPYINRLYELGITTGCGTRLYCPTVAASREQSAVFFVRALGESPSSAPSDAYFQDLGGTTFPGHINRLWELGITEGCGEEPDGDLLYCPLSDLTRSAAAILTARSWGYTTDICD